jgi:hypothetical protein
MNDKVVFLAFTNERVEPDGRSLLACKCCRNKTFTLVYEGGAEFPLLQCPACGSHLGRMGWAPDSGPDTRRSG